MNRAWTWRSLAILPLGMLALSACSPKSMFGGSDDSPSINQYRPINPSCAGMNLHSKEMTSAEFRALLHCFNSYGALDPIEKLFAKLSADQVDAFVGVLNEHVTGDPSFIYDLEQDTLANGTALASSMQAISSFLQNPELASSVLALLDTGDPLLSKEILGALQTLSPQIDSSSVNSALELGLNLTGAEAYKSLAEKLKSNAGGTLNTEGLSRVLVEQFRESLALPGKSIFDDLNVSLSSGELYQALDHLLGTSPDEITKNISILTPVLPTFTANGGEILTGVSKLFDAIKTPVQCLRGTQQVQDPALSMFSEISRLPEGEGADYIRRTHLLTIVTTEPFCDYPAGVKENYSKLVKLADSSAMPGVERMIRAAFPIERKDGTHPIALLFEKFFRDRRTVDALPILSELTERNAWSDLFLLAALPDSRDRGRIAHGVSLIADPSPYLAGKAVKDVLAEAIAGAGTDRLLAVAESLKSILNRQDDQPWLQSILTQVRMTTASSDAHPYIRLAHNLLSDAPSHEVFFKALFSSAKLPEFAQSLKLISIMAQDGRLKQLLGDWVTIFHPVAVKGRHAVTQTAVAPFSPSRRHNLSTRDIPAFAFQQNAFAASDPCAELTPEISISNLTDKTKFDDQWAKYLGCLTAQGKAQSSMEDIESVVTSLQNQTTENGQSELAMIIGLTQNLGSDLSRDELGYLGDLWLRSEDNGNFTRFLDSATHWLDRRIVAPMLDVLSPVLSQSRTSLQVIEDYLARALRREDFPAITSELDRLLSIKSSTTPDAVSSDRSFDESKALIDPYLQKFSDATASAPDHSLADALLNFLGDFSLEEGQRPDSKHHFTRKDFANWFDYRSRDKKIVKQYDISNQALDENPSTIQVDTLERLERVIINADFDEFFLPGNLAGLNFGKSALAEFGDSWGDEPYEVWPDEIKEKYRGRKPPTLRQTVKHLKSTLSLMKGIGVPEWRFMKLNEVKRRVFNLAQTISVLEENLPDSRTPLAGGMKLLRSLFFHLNYSTPEKYRGETAGFKNNLSFIAFICSSGLTREIAWDVTRYPYGSPVIQDYLGAAVSLGSRPNGKALIKKILVEDPRHSLIWNFVKANYGSLHARETLVSGLASLERLHLTESAAIGIDGILKENQDFVLSHIGEISDLLKSQESVTLAEAVYAEPESPGLQSLASLVGSTFEDHAILAATISIVRAIDSDPKAQQGLTDLRSRYQAVSTEEGAAFLGRAVLDFFEEKDGSTVSSSTEATTRKFLADHLESGDFEQILLLAIHNPQSFENLVDTANKYIKNGDIRSFFEYLRRTLKPVN